MLVRSTGVRPGALLRTGGRGRVLGTLSTALMDREALETWLPPDGMRGRVDHWDPRTGGGFRMTLTCPDPTGAPGKTSAGTDVVEVAFTALAPPERVVQQAVFASDDPAYAGTMTMTWDLTPTSGGTRVTVTATGVPSGIGRADHEAGISSSPAQPAAYAEGR